MAQPPTQPPMRPANTETFTQESYNHGGLITFALAMGFSILFFIVLLLVHPGVDLKEAGPNIPEQPQAAPPSPATEQQAQ